MKTASVMKFRLTSFTDNRNDAALCTNTLKKPEMFYFQHVNDRLVMAASFGQRKSENGARLYGHMPWVAPEAWFHQIYPSLSNNEIKLMQGDLLCDLPACISDFFSLTNGLNLFGGSFAIYGRRNMESWAPEIRMPFDIITLNKMERPRGSTPSMLFLGGYRWKDGGYIYINCDNLKAYACTRSDAAPLFQWESFEQMLTHEVDRLSGLFDMNGKKRKAGASELPWDCL